MAYFQFNRGYTKHEIIEKLCNPLVDNTHIIHFSYYTKWYFDFINGLYYLNLNKKVI